MRLFSQRWRSDGSLKVCCCYCMIDVLLAIFVGFLCWLLFSGFVQPYKRGFYCDDQSIRLQYKPNSVSVGLLLTVSISVPILLVVWYHTWTVLIPLLRRDSSATPDSGKSNALAEKLRFFFATGTSICVEYFFGLMVVVALMHFGKSAFGVLRPHFIDVCRPNASVFACDQYRTMNQPRLRAGNAEFDQEGIAGKLTDIAATYIEEPYCTTNDYHRLKVARESFPSGHTAVAVYANLFVLCFIRERSRRGGPTIGFEVQPSSFCPPILKYAFVLIHIAWTLFVCITRVTDNWHHWTDVAGGTILGLGVGAVLFFRKDSAFRTGYLQGKAADY